VVHGVPFGNCWYTGSFRKVANKGLQDRKMKSAEGIENKGQKSGSFTKSKRGRMEDLEARNVGGSSSYDRVARNVPNVNY
jgi:hypothetical protein